MSKTLDFSKDKELIRQDSTGGYIEVQLKVGRAFGVGRLYENGSVLIEKGHYKECVPSANARFKKTYRSDLGLSTDSEGDITNLRVDSISGAANILGGNNYNGYIVWKDKKDRVVDFYRDTANEDAKTPKKRIVAEVLDYKPRKKNLGTEGEPLETLVNPDIKQVLGDKVHLEEGDELTWYKDANIKITWHTDGTCDLFEREHIGICGAVFRILKGKWRDKEHGVGTEANHWIYEGIKVSDILRVYPKFWKACENNLAFEDSIESEDNTESYDSRSYEMSRTSNKETEDKEVVRQPKYDYESVRLKARTTNSDVQCSALRDIDTIKRQLFGEGSNSNQDTPWKIAEDMIDLLPESVWNPQTKFLDIYCKSGIFLEVIKNTLKDKCYEQYKELGLTTDKEINKYIFDKQLFGLCWSKRNYEYTAESLFMVKYPMNSYNIKKLSEVMGSDDDSELVKNEKIGNTDRYIDIKDIQDKLFKEYRGEMKIDVVVGNPPYNKDIYLDFVENGHKIAGEYSCFITPAKWQAKGGDKNEHFRQDIVPHMSKIVYYPCAQEIFDIRNLDGISYYLIDKNNTYEEKSIKNVSNRQLLFNNEREREIDKQLNNVAISIIKKLGTFTSININTSASHFGFGSGEKPCGYGDLEVWSNNTCIGKHDTSDVKKNVQDIKLYKLMMNQMAGNCEYGLSGNVLGMNRMMKLEPNQIAPCNYMMLYKSRINDLEFAESYFNTKLIRFLAQTGLTGQSFVEPECMRFVPDPGTFNKIFEDKPLPGYTPNEQGEYTDKDGNVHCSLYVKYKLTPEEINIIESVIKERK